MNCCRPGCSSGTASAASGSPATRRRTAGSIRACSSRRCSPSSSWCAARDWTPGSNREAIQGERIDQLERQIAGLQRQLVSNRRQRELIQEETTDVDELYRRGLERKSRLLALQREDAALLGAAGELEAQIAQAEEAIGETRLEIMDIRIQRIEEVDEQLAEVQMQRGEAEEELAAADDTLRRTEIVAPIAGTVLDLRFKTTGGVIGPGEPVLDLGNVGRPADHRGAGRPADIDDVAAASPPTSMFLSLPQRRLLRIAGDFRSARIHVPFVPGDTLAGPTLVRSAPSEFEYIDSLPHPAYVITAEDAAYRTVSLAFPSAGENGQAGNLVTARYYQEQEQGRQTPRHRAADLGH